MYRKILVPVDGSSTASAGLREALKLARDGKTTVRLLHVVDEFTVFSTPEGGLNAAHIIAALKASGQQVLEQARRLAGTNGARVESRMVESLGGRVADVIAAHAKGCRADLIVMGTHGRRGVRRLILGSDAEQVVRGSTVPVLLVPAPGGRKPRTPGPVRRRPAAAPRTRRSR